MMGLKEPTACAVWLEPNDDPQQEAEIRLAAGGIAGRALGRDRHGRAEPGCEETLQDRGIAELAAYGGVRPEVKYGQTSRVDFLLTEPGLPDAYVEVKNVHLRRDGDWAEFPDCVTTRGARHLDELSGMVARGHRAVMLYLVQRTDCARFRLADDLDPGYAAAFQRARLGGVEAICYDCAISTEEIRLNRAVPIAV